VRFIDLFALRFQAAPVAGASAKIALTKLRAIVPVKDFWLMILSGAAVESTPDRR